MIAVAAAVMKGLRLFVTVITCALLAYMVVAVGAQVVSRYVFSFSIAWASETATVAQIWMVILGAGLAMRQGMHVGVDLLLRYLPRPVVLVLNLLILVAGIWFFMVVIYGSSRLLKVGSIQRMPTLQIEMFWAYLAIPFGAGYFALEFALATAKRLKLGGSPQSSASH